MKSLVLIGSGNVATHLGLSLLNQGYRITQVWSKKLKNAGILYQLSKSHFKRCVQNKCHDDIDEAYQWCIMGFKSFDQLRLLN